MDDVWIARAYAAEVRAEMARKRVTAAALQEAVGKGLSSSAYQKYFVQAIRPVPSDIQLAVSRVLDVRSSELWRRAEESAPALAARHEAEDPITAELMAGLSKRARKQVEAVRVKPEPEPPTEGTRRGHRSA